MPDLEGFFPNPSNPTPNCEVLSNPKNDSDNTDNLTFSINGGTILWEPVVSYKKKSDTLPRDTDPNEPVVLKAGLTITLEPNSAGNQVFLTAGEIVDNGTVYTYSVADKVMVAQYPVSK